MSAILELNEMPNNCSECKLSVYQRPIYIYCSVTTDDCNEPHKTRNKNCPLKEIEEE